MSSVNPLLSALWKIPGPIAALTISNGDERNGLIVSWFTPVSAEPPRLVVAIRKNRYSVKLIDDAGAFVVNLLRNDQTDLVPLFKLKGDERDKKFTGINVVDNNSGQPVLSDCAASLHCTIIERIDAGDHWLYLAEVKQVDGNGQDPMTTLSLGKTYSGVA